MGNGIQFNTDFSAIKPNQPGGGGFPISPKEGFLCHIVDSWTKENSKKTGTVAVFKLEGLEPAIQGMTHEYGCNVANPTPKSVEIGMSEISAMAHVIGITKVGNSQELYRKPFRVIIRQQKDDDRYTEVAGVLDVNGNAPGMAGKGPLQPQTATQGGFGAGAVQPAGGFAPTGQPQQPQPGGFGQQQPQGGFQPQQPQQPEQPQGFGQPQTSFGGQQQPGFGQPQGGQMPQGVPEGAVGGFAPQGQPQGQPQGFGQPQGQPQQPQGAPQGWQGGQPQGQGQPQGGAQTPPSWAQTPGQG